MSADTIAVHKARLDDFAAGHIASEDGCCRTAAAVAAEVVTLAEVVGQLIQTIERRDEIIGYLLDMVKTP